MNIGEQMKKEYGEKHPEILAYDDKELERMWYEQRQSEPRVQLNEEATGNFLKKSYDAGKKAVEMGASWQLGNVGGVAEWTGNVAKALDPTKYVRRGMQKLGLPVIEMPEGRESFGEAMSSIGEIVNDYTAKIAPSKGTQKTANVMTRTGLDLVVLSGALKIVKGSSWALKGGQYLKNIEQGIHAKTLSQTMAKGAVHTAPKMVELISRSALGTTLITSTANGELPTLRQFGNGLAIDLVLTGFGLALKNMGKATYWAGVNIKASHYGKTNRLVEDAIKQNWIGTKKTIVNRANSVIKVNSEQLSDMHKNVKHLWKKKDFTKNAYKVVEQWKYADPKAYNQGLAYLDDWVATQNKMNFKDIVQAKKVLSKQLQTVWKAGTAGDPFKIGNVKSIKIELWKAMDNQINQVNTQARSLNMEMNLAYSIKDPLEKALNKFPSTNLFSLATIAKLPAWVPATTAAGTGIAKGGELMINPYAAYLLKKEILTQSSW